MLELFDDLLDITRDLVAASDKEGIIGIDNDKVLDADRGDEAFAALDEDVFAPEVDMLTIDDGVMARFGGEEFMEGTPVADIAPLEGRGDDQAILWFEAFDNEGIDGFTGGQGIELCKLGFT